MNDRQAATARRYRIPSCTAPGRSIYPQRPEFYSPVELLAFEAYAKAERARRRWRAAQLAGDIQAAEQARRLMLRHQAIARHLDPDRGAK